MTTVPVLSCKPGCTLDPMAPGGLRLINACDRATMALGHSLVITAGTNGHTTGRHVKGEALDVSVKGLTAHQVVALSRFLKGILGERFTVLYEAPTRPLDPALRLISFVNPKATGRHLHLQVKKGTVFPPTDAVAYA